MNKDNVRLAIAPTGWTNGDMPGLDSENTFQQIVSEMALADFTGSEVGSKYPHDPTVLKPMLDIRGIQICNAWFSTFFANGQQEKTIDESVNRMSLLHAMGAKVTGRSEQGDSIQGLDKPILGDVKPCFNEEEWQRMVKGYNTLGRLTAEEGIQVCLHHHMGIGIQTTTEIDRFMSLVGERVFLLFSTGHTWYSESGEAPTLAILKKCLPHINHVHLKDIRPPVIDRVRRDGLSFLDGVKKDTFTVPDDEVIDFRPVFRLLDGFDYKSWMVVEAEQGPALANPLEYTVKTRKYIRETAGI